MEKGIIADGTLAQDETQIKALWGWREGITESLGTLGPCTNTTSRSP